MKKHANPSSIVDSYILIKYIEVGYKNSEIPFIVKFINKITSTLLNSKLCEIGRLILQIVRYLFVHLCNAFSVLLFGREITLDCKLD